jgi:hypothetical protein
MIKSVEGLKIGGMYFLPKTFATELIAKEVAVEVINIATPQEPVTVPEVATVVGPSRNKVIQPAQRKRQR